MSHASHFSQPAKQFHIKELTRIVNRALSLVEDAKEPNPTVLLMAKTLVGDFGDIAADAPKMSFNELITEAKLASNVEPNQVKTWEHTCGHAMGASALEMAAKIEMKSLTYGKALVQMNRTIAQREKEQEQRANGNEMRARSRNPRPTIPISSASGRGTKPSPKQPYRHANKALRRRKAA